MLTHLLDTSAWLTHIQRESGWQIISNLLINEENRVGISALSLVELHACLRSFGREQEFVEVVEDYRDLFARIVSLDESVAHQTVSLRGNTSSRVPAMDAMIAATALSEGAILVHRDAHFLTIPDDLLQQEMIGDKG